MWFVNMLPELLVIQLLGITLLIYVDLPDDSTLEDLFKAMKDAWPFYIPWIGFVLFFLAAFWVYIICPLYQKIKIQIKNIKIKKKCKQD